MKNLAECPKCGSDDVYGVTRVVGYFAIIENMNDSKISEIIDRKNGDYKVLTETLIKPMKFDFGDDGVYLIGKEECSICVSEKEIIQKALEQAGCNSIRLEEKKLADKNGYKIPQSLTFAVKANVDLNRIPAVIAVKNGKIKYIGYIGDNENPVTIEELIENFKSVYCETCMAAAV
jgi:hypothetical protein